MGFALGEACQTSSHTEIIGRIKRKAAIARARIDALEARAGQFDRPCGFPKKRQKYKQCARRIGCCLAYLQSSEMKPPAVYFATLQGS
jgi:hypothetical protein